MLGECWDAREWDGPPAPLVGIEAVEWIKFDRDPLRHWRRPRGLPPQQFETKRERDVSRLEKRARLMAEGERRRF